MARVWGSDSTCKVGVGQLGVGADYVGKMGKIPMENTGGIYGKSGGSTVA